MRTSDLACRGESSRRSAGAIRSAGILVTLVALIVQATHRVAHGSPEAAPTPCASERAAMEAARAAADQAGRAADAALEEQRRANAAETAAQTALTAAEIALQQAQEAYNNNPTA